MSALLDAVPGYSNNDAFSALCGAILPTQGGGGGWSYLGQGASAPVSASAASILPTAYTILLLQKINTRFPGGTCGNGISYTFSTVINNGINFLLTKQSPTDHGFGENGTSGALETALAYLAISAVNPLHAALGPAQDYLIASQINGAWGNDPFQTALALQTLPVPSPALTFSSNDGIPDVVKTQLAINTVADGRNLLPGNGQSVAGVTASLVVANAVLNQAFNYTLQASGGTPPYTFSILSGSLPDGSPGFALASNGIISGTPTAVGPFNFTYQVRDSLNATASVAGQILVSEPVSANSDNDVPTLPEWGAILMAGLLLTSMVVIDRRRNNNR
ncbi:putative Ig domain-containing protein [Sulfurirhabdus autotrophica]|uniref:putative Ig domain-containing protein n=1 Tax=Sulfurirhabdus autotrophica TaxID=1706046 RepID=UPI000F605F54|nr:putative Ig domain-containing protein [Sulfurirhabdus autotrophica]